MSMGDTDWRPGHSKMVDADFDNLERRYFSQLARTNPKMAEELKLLVEKHNPPKLVSEDVNMLCYDLTSMGTPTFHVELVKRMIKELGLD